MQITKELIEKDIAGTKQQMDGLRASLAQVSGALIVLENIKTYLEKAEAEPEAVPLQDVAEAVAGPGAEVLDITPIEPAITPDMVVNGNGKYVKRKERA